MLSYLASLRVCEKLSGKNDDSKPFGAARSRILYAIGRTYHDQENLVDALSCYLKALLLARGLRLNLSGSYVILKGFIAHLGTYPKP